MLGGLPSRRTPRCHLAGGCVESRVLRHRPLEFGAASRAEQLEHDKEGRNGMAVGGIVGVILVIILIIILLRLV